MSYSGPMTGTLIQPPVREALTAADRCDRCGAQAYLAAMLPTGGELLFCAHHARAHADKLKEMAADIHDETHRLEAPPPAIVQED